MKFGACWENVWSAFGGGSQSMALVPRGEKQHISKWMGHSADNACIISSAGNFFPAVTGPFAAAYKHNETDGTDPGPDPFFHAPSGPHRTDINCWLGGGIITMSWFRGCWNQIWWYSAVYTVISALHTYTHTSRGLP